ncbi:Os03g0573233 [Oryza sativa Japonica Group]|uniref:Os03g0573233 protein n=1 Tax=Oryza sativa subsp. japonica TaxID=39947 RepID=A0A0P0W045_ORYSJ|nr:Os03g0573233 [Oryza sativa Japonica Group]
MTTMLDAIDDLHTNYKTQAINQKHAQQEKIAKLQKMVEQMEDMSQPEDSDTAKMLKYTEACFAQYRKDTNRMPQYQEGFISMALVGAQALNFFDP